MCERNNKKISGTENRPTEKKHCAHTRNPSCAFFRGALRSDDTFREQEITWYKLKMNAYMWK